MAKSKNEPTPSSTSDLAFIATVLGRLLLLGATGVALYLGITSLQQGTIAGCGEGGGCHEVVSSKWGYLFGDPISLFGAATYLTLIAIDIKGCCPRFHALCRWMIIGAALWFVCVQALILHKFCPWCCITHMVAVIGVLFLWKRADGSISLPVLGPVIAALAGLILTQSLGPDRPSTAGGALAEGQETKATKPVPSGPRTVSLHGGKFNVNVQDFPAIGNAQTAEHVAVGLFDFTCPHCRQLTEILTDIQAGFGDQLAVVQLPGHFAPKGEKIHKLMLAVWREDPESYHAVADLLHDGSLQASENLVISAIGAHVDPDKHAEWMTKHDAWSTQVLANSQAIRQTNRGLLKTGKFPQLMIGDYVEAGSKDNPGHYYDLLKEKFGLSRSVIPRIEVEPKSIALGTIYAGGPHKFEIKVRNPGGPTVHLARPQLVRGMRTLPGYAPELKSGEETTLQIIATPPAPGPINGEIVIVSDAEPASFKIPVSAVAKLPYTVEPRLLDLGTFSEKPLQGTTTITFDSPVRLSAPRPNNPKEFQVTMKEVEAGLKYELLITANGKVDDRTKVIRTGLHQTSISIGIQPLSNTAAAWPKQARVSARFQVPPKKGS